MADLKAGTTVGGAGIWNASNLQLTPSGNFLSYRGFKVYTENDKPSAEDIGALSLANGGTVLKAVTLNNTLTVKGVSDVAQITSSYRMGIIRGDGNGYPYLTMVRSDLPSSGTPSSETGISQIVTRLASATSDPYGGTVLTNISTNWRTDGSGKMFIDARQDGAVKSRIVLDGGTGQAAVDIGTFRVAGATQLAALTATTGNFSGALSAASLVPVSFANFDARYMSSIPKTIPTTITSFADPSITETSDVWTTSGTFSDGPLGSGTYTGQLVNYRRLYAAGAALVQIHYSLDSVYIRTGTGSQNAWTWRGGNANGWRKIYDESNKPTASELGVLPLTGGTMSGLLTVPTLRVTGTSTLAVVNATAITASSLSTTGAITSNGVLTLIGNTITGQNDTLILRDHLNGNVTLSGSVTPAGVAGDLYLGYGTTRNIIVQSPIVSTYPLNATAITGTTITGSGDITGSGNIITLGGSFRSRAPSTANNAHIWFENPNGSERGVMYIGNDGLINLRCTAGQMNMQGSVYASANLSAAGSIFTGNGQSYMSTDGNLYGPVWGGWLNNYITGRIDAYKLQGWSDIGSYVMAKNEGKAVAVSEQVEGALLRPAAADGSYDSVVTCPGVWICCGRSITNDNEHRTTLWRRIA